MLTGQVTDQAHLLGLIEQIQELGVELVSINPDQGTDGGAAVLGRNPAGHDGSPARPQKEFACADGCASQSAVQTGEAAGNAQLAAVMMPNAQIAPAGVAGSDRLADRVLP